MDLPSDFALHPVFHVSLLKPATGSYHEVFPLPPMLTEDLFWNVEPKALLGVRYSTSSSAARPQVLIQWKHLPAFEATWEDVDIIQE